MVPEMQLLPYGVRWIVPDGAPYREWLCVICTPPVWLHDSNYTEHLGGARHGISLRRHGRSMLDVEAAQFVHRDGSQYVAAPSAGVAETGRSPSPCEAGAPRPAHRQPPPPPPGPVPDKTDTPPPPTPEPGDSICFAASKRRYKEVSAATARSSAEAWLDAPATQTAPAGSSGQAIPPPDRAMEPGAPCPGDSLPPR